jgi:hypothetical protein
MYMLAQMRGLRCNIAGVSHTKIPTVIASDSKILEVE